MDKIGYGTQLSPLPIKLSIGSLRKPKLREIAEISFEKFGFYEVLMKLTPEYYYEKICGKNGKKYWDSIEEKEKEDLTTYKVILKEPGLSEYYVDIFNFFFEESVVFDGEVFILLDSSLHNINEIESKEQIHGVISENSFDDIMCIIQQICCIDDPKKPDEEKMKFKNSLARKLYEKMQKAAKKNEEKSANPDLSIPNIISAVSNKHPAINPVNVWDLTIFQLLDTFNRMRNNAYFDIDSTRVSVWGDEKKTYKDDLWYKNIYDKK